LALQVSGSGRSARSNLGDCFAYALAKVTGESLLLKGDNFGDTDVEAAELRYS
jgi:ribonuclease VapC